MEIIVISYLYYYWIYWFIGLFQALIISLEWVINDPSSIIFSGNLFTHFDPPIHHLLDKFSIGTHLPILFVHTFQHLIQYGPAPMKSD